MSQTRSGLLDDNNRPPQRWAVPAFTPFGAMLLALLLLSAACQPGPRPTPTIPPDLNRTVTPTIFTATSTVTLIPSLTPSLTPILPTTTQIPSRTPLPTFTRWAPTEMPSATPFSVPPTIAPVTPINPVVVPPTIRGIAATPGGVTNGLPAVAQLPDGFNPEVLVYVPVAGVNDLPVPAVVSVGDLPVAPVNAGFDQGAVVEQGAQEVRVPEGWAAWWRTGPIDCGIYLQLGTTGPCPALESEGLTYKRPEFTVIPGSGRWMDPPRVIGDGNAARFFCTYGICEGGYVQRVQVSSGASYTLSAMVHAWCNSDTMNIYASQLGIQDDLLNCELAVGLDPTGGLDPFSPTVIWQAITAYDQYALVSTPPVQATGGAMTLFLRGRSLWGIRHNDFHFDQVTFSGGDS